MLIKHFAKLSNLLQTVVDHTCRVLGFLDYIFGLYCKIDDCWFRCPVRGACIGILLFLTAHDKGCGQAGHRTNLNIYIDLQDILMYLIWYIDVFYMIYWCILYDILMYFTLYILMYFTWYIDVFFFLRVDCGEWHQFLGHWYLWDPTPRTFIDSRVSKLQFKGKSSSLMPHLTAQYKKQL